MTTDTPATPTPHVNAQQYQEMYAASIADPDAFWGEQGKRLDWIQPYTKVKDVSFAPGNVSIKWYEDGVLNVSANCIVAPAFIAASRWPAREAQR